jgi:mRNA-degrading endonuclease RelE of RelBE toxin-antitoxin system
MKNETLGFRIKPTIKRELRKLAKKKNQTLSDLSRELLYHAISLKQPELLTSKNQ